MQNNEYVRLKGEILQHKGAVFSITGNKKHFFSASSDCFAVQWNTELLTQENFVIKADKAIYKACFIEENGHLLLGLSNGDIHVIDTKTKQEIKFFQVHKQAVFEIIHSPNKHYIFSSDADGNVCVWDTKSYNLLLTIPFSQGKIRNISFSLDGTKLFIPHQSGQITVLDAENFNELHSFFAHQEGANQIIEVADRSYTYISSGKDGHIKLWNADFTLYKSYPAHNFGIYRVLVMQNGQQLVSCSRDKSIKLWDLKQNSLDFIFKLERKHGGHSHAVNDLLKLDEFNFASTSDDKRINFWELC